MDEPGKICSRIVSWQMPLVVAEVERTQTHLGTQKTIIERPNYTHSTTSLHRSDPRSYRGSSARKLRRSRLRL